MQSICACIKLLHTTIHIGAYKLCHVWTKPFPLFFYYILTIQKEHFNTLQLVILYLSVSISVRCGYQSWLLYNGRERAPSISWRCERSLEASNALCAHYSVFNVVLLDHCCDKTFVWILWCFASWNRITLCVVFNLFSYRIYCLVVSKVLAVVVLFMTCLFKNTRLVLWTGTYL